MQDHQRINHPKLHLINHLLWGERGVEGIIHETSALLEIQGASNMDNQASSRGYIHSFNQGVKEESQEDRAECMLWEKKEAKEARKGIVGTCLFSQQPGYIHSFNQGVKEESQEDRAECMLWEKRKLRKQGKG
ncbi:hypothetical protein O6P43_017177 [Quillaja saponaria]|uniref:Uncharacterized protein n=1 Tax=Quillaja saponaria TaxID=32244 RepID=A0AAD7LPD0_QUISA|nr:hypothetical protein O6P43_017177 [Quillaja saponaria]